MDPARLFDEKPVKWGTLRLKSLEHENDPSKAEFLDFLYVVDDINLEFTPLDLK